jgi:outer membrane protein OmpA-like peptidoglycan-associated protein
MLKRIYLLGTGLLGTGLMVGCASDTTTRELLTARDAYTQAMHSKAATVNPTGLYEAKQVLTRAEQAHSDDPGSVEERDLAYIAHRRVELAVAKANELLAKQNQVSADQKYKSELENNASNLRQQSDTYAEQLKDAKGDIASLEAKRAAAEKREQEARRALENLAAVKQEQNRMVVTLSGSVLFKSASADLLDIAKDRLNSVAEALKSYGEAAITVEGYTDSRGTDEANLRLSQQRADSVRNYLVSQGLSDATVKAVGKGEASPVADNATPEGQATNRRVEIVIDRSGTASNPSQTTGTELTQSPPKPAN